MITRLLSAQETAAIWSEILAPMLEPAVERSNGRMRTQDILAGVGSNQFGAWVACDGDQVFGCAIAQRLAYARRKALNVLFIAGHHRELWGEAMGAALEAFARANGLDLIEGLGRRGFERILPGFRVSAVAYEKELT